MTATDKKAEYLVLARKYRPQNFSELKGQDALVRTLTNAIESGRVAHAFMLTGVRGIGKTTTARIIARALNCIGKDGAGGPTATPCGECDPCISIAKDRNMDVLEMDAASRTGVDDVREIIDSVQYAPTSARYKIYIIDEVHMLSNQAFNALLKTLEEPPENVKFIFATTEIRKVPITVLSRCQRFDLRRISLDILVPFFQEILEKEGLTAEDEALKHIARAADGSARDGLSLLDQAIALSNEKIETQTVQDMLGLVDRALLFDLYDALMAGDSTRSFATLETLYDTGASPVQIVDDLLNLTHFLTKCNVIPGHADDPSLPEIERRQGGAMAEKLSVPILTRTWQILTKGAQDVRFASSPLHDLEMLLIRLLYAANLPSAQDLVKKLTAEGKGAASTNSTGSASVTPAPSDALAPQAAIAQMSESVIQTEPNAPMMMEQSTNAHENVVSLQQVGQGAAQALAPQPQADIKNDEIVPIVLNDLTDVVALCNKNRQALLAAGVSNHMHLVAFKQGEIECRLSESADRSLPGKLSKALSDWTGQRWVVSLSQKPGQPTLKAKQDEETNALKLKIMNDKNVGAIIMAFPGTEIIEMTPLTQRQDAKDAIDE